MTSIRNQYRSMTQPSAADPPAGPTGRSQRLHGLDAARAIAIMGMIAVNVGPRKENGDTDLAVVIYDLPHGRASILFMILAGVGMSLMTRRTRNTGAPLPWKTIVWRALLLIFSGLALQLLNHDVSVILTYYGVLFFSCLPLLRAPTWLVTLLAGITLILGPILWLLLQQQTATTFDFMAPSLSDPLWTILHATLLTGAYPVLIWFAPLLFGIVLGRLNLADRRVQNRLIGWGALSMLVAFGLSAVLMVFQGRPQPGFGWNQLISTEAHSMMPLWLISGIGIAVLIIGLLLRTETWVSRRLSWLVSAGRLSLTIYVAHLFVLAWLIRPGPESLLDGYLISTAMCVFFVVAAHLWLRKLGTGPLERLLSWPPSLAR